MTFTEGSAKEIHGRGKGSSRNVGHEQSSAAPVLQRSDPSRWAPALFDHARALLWGVGQTLATEAIAECIRCGGVWEAESKTSWRLRPRRTGICCSRWNASTSRKI